MKKDIAFQIKSAYQDMRPSEQQVADYLLNHREQVATMSLKELAKKSKVSEPTIVRMVKAVGFSGFKELRDALIREAARKSDETELQAFFGYHVKKEDKVSEIPEKITANTIEVMKDTLKSISVRDFQKVIEAIAKADKIQIFAVENSDATASDLNTKLTYLGLDCRYARDYYLQRIGAGYLTEKDVAIGISYSGCSRDTVDAMREAKKRKAKTIVITNFRDSLITKYADFILCTSQEQLMYGDAIFSRVSQMMIVDMIYTGLITSNYDTYAKRLDCSGRIIRDKAYE